MLYLNGIVRQELVPYDLPLVVPHTESIISFHLWCILGGSVWNWMKSNLFGPLSANPVLEHLVMPKWIESSMNQYRMFFIQTSTLLPSIHQKTYQTWKCCLQNIQKVLLSLMLHANFTHEVHIYHKFSVQLIIEKERDDLLNPLTINPQGWEGV